jgi:hypothetical protein
LAPAAVKFPQTVEEDCEARFLPPARGRSQESNDRLFGCGRNSWKSANERYLAWRRERGDLHGLAAMLTEPLSFRYFDDVAV